MENPDVGKREGVMVNTHMKVGCYVGNPGFGRSGLGREGGRG